MRDALSIPKYGVHSAIQAYGGVCIGRGVGNLNMEVAMRIVYVDKNRCLGCFNCERACALHRFAHDGSSQSYIRVDVDFESRIVRTSTCRQCKNAACARVCPTGALVRNPQTGIIAVNMEICIGCANCEQACVLGNVRIIPELGAAGKCDLCGGDPQCVQSCFARALLFDSLRNVIRLIKEKPGGNLAIRAIGEDDVET